MSNDRSQNRTLNTTFETIEDEDIVVTDLRTPKSSTTSRPLSGREFLTATTSTPTASRSPSIISSNRDSYQSQEDQAERRPVLPPRRTNGDANGVDVHSLSNFEPSYNNILGSAEDMREIANMTNCTRRKRAPPPPPPNQNNGSETPPTPPRVPLLRQITDK